MGLQNVIPDIVLGSLAQIQRDVAELKRRTLPGLPNTSSGFPVGPYDDGTATYAIQAGTFGGVAAPGYLVTSVVEDGTGHQAVQVQVVNPAANVAEFAQVAQVGGDVARVGALATATYTESILNATNNTSQFAQVRVRSDNSGSQIVDLDGNAIIIGHSSTDTLGFFSSSFSAQVATPVTLGDVIALLQAYGLSA
jgi:hypothetical protein